MNNLQESILDAMKVFVKDSTAKLNFPLTLECEIVKCTDEDKGEYEVNYLDNHFLAYCQYKGYKYNKGEVAYVLIPKGDFSKTKIILGIEKDGLIDSIVSGGSFVKDVKVNGVSVVTNQIARLSAVSQQELINALSTKVNVTDFETLENEVDNLSDMIDKKASQQDLDDLSSIVDEKADASDVEAELAEKVDLSTYNTDMSLKADKTALDLKQDQLEFNTQEVATETLTRLKADNVVYNLGGGGAEVEANPSEPATDDLNTIKIGDTVYDIPSGGGGGTVMMSNYYSEDEQVVGRWTDGKPLYQKNIVISNLAIDGNWHSVAHNINNIDNMCFIDGSVKRSDTKAYFSISSYRPDTLQGLLFRVDQTCINYVNNWISLDNAVITLQYTKTTDAPGTGPTKGNLIYLPALYSEEEREVGVWTDGKPLYQKLVHISPIQTGDNRVFVHGISDIDKPIECEIRAFSISGGVNYVTMPFRYNETYDVMNISFSQVQIQYSLGTAYSDYDLWAICKYTKTTDQPGSGTWTPEGQLAHHYSTSEKVVGTWIDGSTVYERTVVLSTPLYINSNVWASNIIDLQGQKIVKIDAYNPDDYIMPIMGGFLNGVLEVCNFRPSRITVDKFVIQYTKSS